MKLQELLEGIEVIECTASPELEISGVSADSRQVQPGGLFVAVPLIYMMQCYTFRKLNTISTEEEVQQL